MTCQERQRRAICIELLIDYEAVRNSGPALAKLDRLIELRSAMPEIEAEHLAVIDQWTKTESIQ
jgi:hypothetical protein